MNDESVVPAPAATLEVDGSVVPAVAHAMPESRVAYSPQVERAGTRPLELVAPSPAYLPGYIAALERGWSDDAQRTEERARAHLAQIANDAATFLLDLDSRSRKGSPIRLPDGTEVERLPGYQRWLWDGEFCGNISLRWQRGTTALPPHCLGHIGYNVVPWKRNRGYATRALGETLRGARAEGLPFVELTTDADNHASQKVIARNGGLLYEHFTKPPQFGSTPGLRYRIALTDS